MTEMRIKIRNKIFVLKEDYFSINDSKIIYIRNKPCEKNILGVKFLNLFDLYEFEYPKEEVNLYQNTKKIILTE